MTDHADLIKRLRLENQYERHPLSGEAADALEAQQAEIERLEGFAKLIKNKWVDSYFMDLDGGDVQDIFLKSGLGIERPATQKDIDNDDGLQEYGTEPGDPIIRWNGDWWK
jgi:hypothetical protein